MQLQIYYIIHQFGNVGTTGFSSIVHECNHMVANLGCLWAHYRVDAHNGFSIVSVAKNCEVFVHINCN